MTTMQRWFLPSLALLGSIPAHSLTHDKCPLKVPASIRTNPIVIAHRGASFHLPEHTLQAYRLALELGADYIEPDLVASKDGKLVAMHTVDLSVTTNVAEIFPNRTSYSKHLNETGYYVYDFKLEELKQLSVIQRLPDARSVAYDGLFSIPSLEEILELLHEWNTEILPSFTKDDSQLLPRAGLYAELKDPIWIKRDSNQSLVELFLDTLAHSPHANFMWDDKQCNSLKFDQYLVPPLVVQCFEDQILEELHHSWIDDYNNDMPPPLVRLVPESECLVEGEALNQFWYHIGEQRSFLSGIGPDKKCLFPLERAEEFKRRAIEYELAIHPWTERPESKEVNEGFTTMQEELRYLFCKAKVDGIFSEHVPAAILAGHESCDDDDDDTPEEEPPTPSPAPTNSTGSDASNLPSDSSAQCEDDDAEPILVFGLAAGVMGLFVGSIVTFWFSQSTYCRGRGGGRRQLVIPQHDDELEMI